MYIKHSILNGSGIKSTPPLHTLSTATIAKSSLKILINLALGSALIRFIVVGIIMFTATVKQSIAQEESQTSIFNANSTEFIYEIGNYSTDINVTYERCTDNSNLVKFSSTAFLFGIRRFIVKHVGIITAYTGGTSSSKKTHRYACGDIYEVRITSWSAMGIGLAMRYAFNEIYFAHGTIEYNRVDTEFKVANKVDSASDSITKSGTGASFALETLFDETFIGFIKYRIVRFEKDNEMGLIDTMTFGFGHRF